MHEKQPLFPNRLTRLMTGFKADFLRLEFPARFLQVCRYAARELREHRARQMAAALTFHTIFAPIPVVVLAILVFRALGGEALLGEFIDQLLGAVRLQDLAGAIGSHRSRQGWRLGHRRGRRWNAKRGLLERWHRRNFVEVRFGGAENITETSSQ